MSKLSDLGFTVVPMKPNAEGLCVYRIINTEGREIGRTDPCTTEDAYRAINAWLEEMPTHKDAKAPKKEIELGVWNWFGT